MNFRYPLFTIHYSLFTIHYSLFVIRCAERLFEVGDQVLHVFDADGNAQEAVVDPARLAFLPRERPQKSSRAAGGLRMMRGTFFRFSPLRND